MGIAVSMAILPLADANASNFAGGYVNANISVDRSVMTGENSKNVGYPGLGAGYNWDMRSIVLGFYGFGDLHKKAYTGTDNGFDAKLGVPVGRWMPYAKLGFAGTDPGTRAHGGLGMEFKLANNWAFTGEWTTDRKTKEGINYKNNDFGIGLNYYFYTPKAVQVAEAETAPVIIKAPEPVPITLPVPEPAPVKMPEPAPVAVPEPTPEPAPVPAIVPQPVAEPLPVPQPVESWKTIVVEKPFTLEGASFPVASDKLLKSAEQKLAEVIAIAKRYPDMKFEVSGHTDNQNKTGKNQMWSERRAAAVKAYLVKNGVAASRIVTAGYADTRPVADNATEKGRAANRRVEIRYMLK
jgi:outer membrane protein OmpA-like peptidoglycan-associated protein